MLSRLLVNWPIKLLAVAIAIALRTYVISLVNPHTTRLLSGVFVQARNVPSGYLVTEMPRTVTIQVSGPSSQLDPLRPDDPRIVASVNLAAAHAGQNSAEPISVSLSPDLADEVGIDTTSPEAAPVTIERMENARMRVRVSFARTAPAGYNYLTPVVSPTMATVSGPTSTLSEVRELVAYADVGGQGVDAVPATIAGTYDVIPLDDHGAQVQGVTVAPQVARVTIPIVKVAAMKELVVSPVIEGHPVYPWTIESVLAQPTMVTVAGSAPTIGAVSIARTNPVSVSSATATVRKEVGLELPSGLRIVGSPKVIVEVRIARLPEGSGTPAARLGPAAPASRMHPLSP